MHSSFPYKYIESISILHLTKILNASIHPTKSQKLVYNINIKFKKLSYSLHPPSNVSNTNVQYLLRK